jgi:hypothetical protein
VEQSDYRTSMWQYLYEDSAIRTVNQPIICAMCIIITSVHVHEWLPALVSHTFPKQHDIGIDCFMRLLSISLHLYCIS